MSLKISTHQPVSALQRRTNYDQQMKLRSKPFQNEEPMGCRYPKPPTTIEALKEIIKRSMPKEQSQEKERPVVVSERSPASPPPRNPKAPDWTDTIAKNYFPNRLLSVLPKPKW